jgi:hypothetical protein
MVMIEYHGFTVGQRVRNVRTDELATRGRAARGRKVRAQADFYAAQREGRVRGGTDVHGK